MRDTHHQIESKMIEMLLKKSGLERLEMGCSLFDFSKQLVVSAILRENPTLSLDRIKQEVFLRFYGDDFNSVQKLKILSRLVEKENLP